MWRRASLPGIARGQRWLAAIRPEEVEPFDPDGQLTDVSNNKAVVTNTVSDGEEKTSQDRPYGEDDATEAKSNETQVASSSGDLEGAVEDANDQFKGANMRITSTGRTPRRQAELMAQRRMSSRDDFLGTYTNHPYILEMDQWVTDNPDAPYADVADEFERIVNDALDAGYEVSKHIEGFAIDVSIPQANKSEVKSFLEGAGIRVLDESGSGTGPHWHLDYQ